MTTILLVDDHQMLREGLRSLLAAHPGMSVVAEAENGRRAVELVKELRPDVVIMDVTMPEMNGIDATRQVKAALPRTHVIALSIHSDRRYVLQMFQAGASGYLLKDCAFEEVTRAIHAVSDGQAYLSSGIAGVVVGELLLGRPAEEFPGSSVLSAREREVLQLLAEGKSTKEIAAILKVSPKTIETHRRQIMIKLQMNSVAELTKYAIREGIISL